jgi:Cft2 family RNA processing exonuclease
LFISALLLCRFVEVKEKHPETPRNIPLLAYRPTHGKKASKAASMNQDSSCHLLANSIYIDGFSAYNNQWHSPLCSWFLSHYHADHYKGLKRGKKGKKQLKGTIHCTQVTKLLLERVHFVDDEGIDELLDEVIDEVIDEGIDEGIDEKTGERIDERDTKDQEVATTKIQSHQRIDERDTKDQEVATTKIQSHPYGEEFKVKDGKGGFLSCTFLPANHCPGAAILLFSTSSDPQTINIHCGDMRYSPELLEAVLKRRKKGEKFGEVFLDTTYGFPKVRIFKEQRRRRT